MKKIILTIISIFLLASYSFAIETKNEQTAITLEMTTKDVDDNDFIASTIKYKVTDINTDTEIISSTSVAPTSAITDITIPAISNMIINDSLSYEERLVSFEVYYGSVVIYSGEYSYRLKNLIKIPL